MPAPDFAAERWERPRMPMSVRSCAAPGGSGHSRHRDGLQTDTDAKGFKADA